MRYCPQCGSEYEDGIEVCADCQVLLLREREFQAEKKREKKFQEDMRELVKVFTLRNRFEADVIKSALEKEGIPVMIRSFVDTAYNGIYLPQKGWGEVRVPEGKREKALEIIVALEKIFGVNED